MELKKYFNKDNLHHAYLIEGESVGLSLEIKKLLEDFGVSILGNPDFYEMSFGSLKMVDALYIKSCGENKSYSGEKKIFIIKTNSILNEAQNTLLKLFEEPIHDTHFFVILPDLNGLLPTFRSRFYIIARDNALGNDLKQAQSFVSMNARERINFLSELLTVEGGAGEDDEEEEVPNLNSKNATAQQFLNSLERVLHDKYFSDYKHMPNFQCFDQIFKARKYLRQPGSSAKMLLESVAILIP